VDSGTGIGITLHPPVQELPCLLVVEFGDHLVEEVDQGVPRPAVGSGSTLQVLASLRALRYDPSRIVCPGMYMFPLGLQ
jgi:hypothetical protein